MAAWRCLDCEHSRGSHDSYGCTLCDCKVPWGIVEKAR